MDVLIVYVGPLYVKHIIMIQIISLNLERLEREREREERREKREERRERERDVDIYIKLGF